jgi:SAM-dependent methyltransferase
MIELGAQAVREAGLEARVTAIQGTIPGLALPERSFDAVVSKDLLHHLPNPSALWIEARRLGRPGAVLYVMDLIRPATPQEVHDIVERVASSKHPILKEDFFNSLCAAFTMEEVTSQLRDAGLTLQVGRIDERHLLVRGRLPR